MKRDAEGQTIGRVIPVKQQNPEVNGVWPDSVPKSSMSSALTASQRSGAWGSEAGERGLWGDRVVVGPITQHGEQDIAAAPRESDQCLVVTLALAELALVTGAGDRVTQRSECREEQRA